MKAASPPRFRVAPPSRNLNATTSFYTCGLGLTVLTRFEDHAGIDGVILGHPGWPYHLELTCRRRDPISPAPTAEDLLVFFLPDQSDWTSAVAQLRSCGAKEVVNVNPYWGEHGATFEDPDGNLVVLQNAAFEG
jgi:catechol 2,3-dioxygenase-like lactoylglutathione lyase family enzyme